MTKRIVAIVWDTVALHLSHVAADLTDVIQADIFSAREVSTNMNAQKICCDACEHADFLILNITSGDSVWNDLSSFLDELPAPRAYVGSALPCASSHDEQSHTSMIINRYYTYAGYENYKNMLLWAAQEAGDTHLQPAEVEEVPWEGIFDFEGDNCNNLLDEVANEQELSSYSDDAHTDSASQLRLSNQTGGICNQITKDSSDRKNFSDCDDSDCKKVHYYKSFFEYASHIDSNKPTVGIFTSRFSIVNGDFYIERTLMSLLRSKGFNILAFYSYAWPEDNLGARGPRFALQEFCFDKQGKSRIDALIRLGGFFMTGRSLNTEDDLLKKLNCPIAKPVCSLSYSVSEWKENPDATLSNVAWSIALPEMEGCIEPIFIGGKGNEYGDSAQDRSSFNCSNDVQSRIHSSNRELKENSYALLSDASLRVPVLKRCQKLVDRIAGWVRLAQKPNCEKRIVFMLNNSPCASVEASVGGGANLDTLESVARLLQRLKKEGWNISYPPQSGDDLIHTIMEHKAISDFRWTSVREIVERHGVLHFVSKEEYHSFFDQLPAKTQQAMIDAWGAPPGTRVGEIPPAMVYNNQICVTGISYGNALVCVQPKRGCAGSRCDGRVCKILHDPHVPPTHQYVASYKYFEHIYKADLIVHVGTHGNLEFLPGRATALGEGCFPDICIGALPHLYLYNADNPPEGTIAKRRALACLIDHMQTAHTTSGLYDDLLEIDQLIAQRSEVVKGDPAQARIFEKTIRERILHSRLATQIDSTILADDASFDVLITRVHELLTRIRCTQIADGMHIFGDVPTGKRKVAQIYAALRYEDGVHIGMRSILAQMLGLSFTELQNNVSAFIPAQNRSASSVLEVLDELAQEVIELILHVENMSDLRLASRTINDSLYGELSRLCDKHGLHFKMIPNKRALDLLINRCLDIASRIDASTETDSFLNASNAGYISPGPSGVITRGRDDVLPTGRNFYTLDPDTLPTRAAFEIGKQLGIQVIKKFKCDVGRYPETFGMYWMCNDLMWGGGEGLGQLFYLIGVKPRWASNGKVHTFEIIPLQRLTHPRIDVSVKISGILRDNFLSRVVLLDKAIRAVCALDEPLEMNYVRKHSLQYCTEGVDKASATARIFGARPGTYLNGVALQIYASAWKDESEIADIYTRFNSYTYGEANYGHANQQLLKSCLKTMDVTYNKIMSDDHDLLGCSCYFGVQGGMTAAARTYSQRNVLTYYGDSREPTHIEIRTLSEELDRIAASKLLNPRWIEGQKRHGYKACGDINKRIGHLYGWQATTREVKNWVFDELVRTYVQNSENERFFKENNPWAMEEIERRLIEAAERGLWQPAPGLMESLQESYIDFEGVLEEGVLEGDSDIQGGEISMESIHDISALNKADIFGSQ